MIAVAKQLICATIIVLIVTAIMLSVGVAVNVTRADYECSDYMPIYVHPELYEAERCSVDFFRRDGDKAAHVRVFTELWTEDRSAGWLSWCYIYYNNLYKCVDLKLEYGAASGVTTRYGQQ